ncbi:MAG: Gldg family protein, partial [Clostridia bacterium]|nr:Gldg family protein [Clostridia bacterium]
YRHDFRLLGRDSFYSFNYGGSSSYNTVEAFKGDYRFAASIMALCSENLPTAYLISGHGEKIGPYTVGKQNVDYGNAQYFCQVLMDCGFRIKKIDLQHEDFEKQKNAIAVIYSPETDYSSNSEVGTHNELGKLSAFLSEKGHSLMVFFDYGTQSLPGLEGFLKDNCSITVENAQLKDSGENSVDVAMQQIVGKLNTNGSGAGAELGKRISDAGINYKIVFPNVRPILIGEGKDTSAVCLVPSTAYGDCDGERKDYPEGSAATATMTRTQSGSYIFCIGTSYAADVYFADNAVYADRDMFIGALDMMSDEDAPFNIEYRIMKGEGLDLTKSQSTTAMIIISAAIPTAVLLIGTVVFIRRRHS